MADQNGKLEVRRVDSVDERKDVRVTKRPVGVRGKKRLPEGLSVSASKRVRRFLRRHVHGIEKIVIVLRLERPELHRGVGSGVVVGIGVPVGERFAVPLRREPRDQLLRFRLRDLSLGEGAPDAGGLEQILLEMEVLVVAFLERRNPRSRGRRVLDRREVVPASPDEVPRRRDRGRHEKEPQQNERQAPQHSPRAPDAGIVAKFMPGGGDASQ